MWTSNALNREADIDHCPADTNPSIEPRDRRETEVETGESMRMMEPLVQGKAALMQTHSGVFLLASLRLWERNKHSVTRFEIFGFRELEISSSWSGMDQSPGTARGQRAAATLHSVLLC
ncbi:hypothetical protein NQZ68_026738 [Dissostichus eleginoides]|nr:hypothetical protein NQZ68_026738 [Dissostichus eleginoides]